ncbi:rRNA methyltransferase [Lederbergia graminis]|uniref:rRNA methyltransferase n=1 Tax=Lederbergia graminis TaxID=735518 RepID=A0ABW0LFE5_9BACI|nr:rRNA methyltransferase [Paenibacillus bovis]
MWKMSNGRLIQVTDSSRIKFRTNISKSLLHQLTEIAEKYNTHVNYLLESGLENLLKHGIITFNKKNRPKDRVQYKTTYDKELLESIKKFAEENDLFINDVIEYSTQFIDYNNVKDSDYRYRVE